MSSIKAQKEINKAVRHLMDFITASPIWAPRFEDLMEGFFTPIAKKLDWSTDDVASGLLAGPVEHMAWDFLIEQMATIYWTIDDEFKSAIDDYLKTRGWREGTHGRQYLRAFADSEVKFWEVTDVEAGAWVDVRPYGTENKPVRVIERTASQSISKWTALAARVIPMGSKRLFSGALIPLTPQTALHVQSVIEKEIADMELAFEEDKKSAEAKGITEDIHFEHDEEFQAMFPETVFTFWAVDVLGYSERPAPRLKNTDNEELIITNYRFPKITKLSFIRDQFNNHPAIMKEEKDTWVWLKNDDSNTVFGRLKLEKKQLHFETNSVERGELGLEQLQSLLGDALQKEAILVYENPEIMTSGEPMTDGFDPELQNDPEVQEILQQHLMQHYRNTLDESIPMLDNETPRACAADPDKQHKVINWLKMLANSDKSTPGVPQDFDWMWHELGLQEHLPQSSDDDR